MFEHIFHVIHMILKSSGTTKDFDKSLDLLAAFTADDIAISQQPERFMEDFFIPVAEAMDRIFNWRELKLQDSEEDSMTLYVNACNVGFAYVADYACGLPITMRDSA